MTKKQAFKMAAWETIRFLFNAEFWIDFFGSIALFIGMLVLIAFRILLVLIFPISIPLIAWAIYSYHKKAENNVAEIKKRIRKDIHLNGRTSP